MTPSFTPDKDRVVQAVNAVRSTRRELLEKFHVRLFEERLDLSFGAWVLPAELLPNGPIDAYDLSNALMEIQRDIEQKSGQEVTVFLEH
jgi:hypothetical protein